QSNDCNNQYCRANEKYFKHGGSPMVSSHTSLARVNSTVYTTSGILFACYRLLASGTVGRLLGPPFGRVFEVLLASVRRAVQKTIRIGQAFHAARVRGIRVEHVP